MYQIMKESVVPPIVEEIRPAVERVLCAKTINIHAQHAAIGPKSNV